MADPADRLYLTMLVIRSQTGDPAAFEELVHRCQPRLRGFLYKMLGSQNHLEDLTQDVWTEVFRSLPQLNDPGAFLPWFYRVARNRAFRLLRNQPAALGSLDEGDMALAAAEEPDFTGEDARAVHAALRELGPEHREVLLLRFMEDMTYEEIAAVVGCQLGTVRSRIHNAKRELRIIIQHKAG
jgi:RNA polymerase sigma-70 factor (ECF subfamily)